MRILSDTESNHILALALITVSQSYANELLNHMQTAKTLKEKYPMFNELVFTDIDAAIEFIDFDEDMFEGYYDKADTKFKNDQSNLTACEVADTIEKDKRLHYVRDNIIGCQAHVTDTDVYWDAFFGDDLVSTVHLTENMLKSIIY